jgi:hypothetical protein
MGDRRRFADAVDECFARGVKGGRKAGDWKHIEPTEVNYSLYQEKVRSHLTRFDITGDPAHLAAVACNAEILWEMAFREGESNRYVGWELCDRCGAASTQLTHGSWTNAGPDPGNDFYVCPNCSVYLEQAR